MKIELRARLSGRRARTRLNLKSSYPAQGLPVRDVGAFGWLNAMCQLSRSLQSLKNGVLLPRWWTFSVSVLPTCATTCNGIPTVLQDDARQSCMFTRRLFGGIRRRMRTAASEGTKQLQRASLPTTDLITIG